MLRTESEFNAALKQNPDILIIFGHPLCQPCQKIFLQIPIVYTKCLLKKRTLRFCNIRELPKIGEKYQIEWTPTLIHFIDGKEQTRITKYKEVIKYF